MITSINLTLNTHIHTSSADIGGYKDFLLSVPKPLDDGSSLIHSQLSTQQRHLVAILHHLHSQPFSISTSLQENQRPAPHPSWSSLTVCAALMSAGHGSWGYRGCRGVLLLLPFRPRETCECGREFPCPRASKGHTLSTCQSSASQPWNRIKCSVHLLWWSDDKMR